MVSALSQLLRDVRREASSERARSNAWYFKTGKGEYGEGDRFRGLSMGMQRLIAKRYRDLGFADIETLLRSKWHEERMIGFLLLISRYERAEDDATRESVFDFFLAHREALNNWDLVDVTVPRVIGDFVRRFPMRRGILEELFRSNSLWERRMAILATFAFIRTGRFDESLDFSRRALDDRRDLIHKAIGWMLREIGKRDEAVLVSFLDRYASKMPRTMLRYAIEKFPPDRRKRFLALSKV